MKSTSVRGQTKSKAKGRLIDFVSKEDTKRWNAEKKKIGRKIAAVKAELEILRKQHTAKHVARRIAKLPADVREDVRKMLAVPKEKRTPKQKQLAVRYEKRLRITDAQLRKLDRIYLRAAVKTQRAVKTLTLSMPGPPAIRALWDRGVPSPTYLFRRGETNKPGQLVGPGVPSVLTDGKTPFVIKPPWPNAKKTGRRLAFAKWITQPEHPLTARVMVNRIWNHHFGRGIVKTLGNFGKTGSRPTHPELLDWLATEFVKPTNRVRLQTEKPWSVKHIHRLILTSSAYRQVSKTSDRLLAADPENALVSRMPLKRMEAEVVRDAILAVAGELDVTPFGQPDPVIVRADGLVTSKRGKNGWRRSIYVLHRRKEMPTILENFDLPQMIPNCVERPKSTVPAQALHLMNNGMIRGLAVRFAKRVQKEAGADFGRQVDRVYQLALSRLPSNEEKALALDTLKKLTQAWQRQLKSTKKPFNPKTAPTRALTNFCHTIINSAAFLYVD
ncbi:MAG: DUF1553 domain-containing protein [Planctomycetes bacterium]|nr:DUF1553 domain-containing protein [Planctomycetota bacterium]